MHFNELDIWERMEIQRGEQQKAEEPAKYEGPEEQEGFEMVAQANQIVKAANQEGVWIINLDRMECLRKNGETVSGKRGIENLANRIASGDFKVDVHDILSYISLVSRTRRACSSAGRTLHLQ